MASNQNPIHRDRGKRGEGAQPFKDNKEALTQKGAEIDRAAPFPEDQVEHLTDEQREELAKQHASQRLAAVQDDVEKDRDESEENV